MFNIILRRLQKYTWFFRGILSVIAGVGVYELAVNTAPDLGKIILMAGLIATLLTTASSLFFSLPTALVVGLGGGLVLFLKAVDLVNPTNLVLVVLFLGLLGFYFRRK